LEALDKRVIAVGENPEEVVFEYLGNEDDIMFGGIESP
jgi:hypothetical protein